jgi:hypothetical protein
MCCAVLCCAAVQKRESDTDAAFAELETLLQSKLEVLKDDLAREDYREKLELQAEQHVQQYNTLKAWVDDKEAYLKVKEEVKSGRDASTHLAKLSAYDKSKAEQTETTLAAFKKLGAEIVAAKYETKISNYAYPSPKEVTDREGWVNGKWAELDTLVCASLLVLCCVANLILIILCVGGGVQYNSKLAVLSDDLAREEFKEKLLLSNQSHSETSTTIRAWIGEREAYLQKKETVESVRDARSALTALELYAAAKADMTSGTVAAFHKLTKHLLDSKYETKLSTYVLENPAEVKERDEFVVGKWAKLDELYAAKLAGTALF